MQTGLKQLCCFLMILGAPTWSTASQATFEVAAVTPSNGAGDVDPVSAQIIIAFDRPIVPLVSNENKAELPQPLTLNPNVSGVGQWVTISLYVFSPSSDTLKANAVYIATIHSGFAIVDGSVLANDYQWAFRTTAPQPCALKRRSQLKF